MPNSSRRRRAIQSAALIAILRTSTASLSAQQNNAVSPQKTVASSSFSGQFGALMNTRDSSIKTIPPSLSCDRYLHQIPPSRSQDKYLREIPSVVSSGASKEPTESQAPPHYSEIAFSLHDKERHSSRNSHRSAIEPPPHAAISEFTTQVGATPTRRRRNGRRFQLVT